MAKRYYWLKTESGLVFGQAHQEVTLHSGRRYAYDYLSENDAAVVKGRGETLL